MCVLVMDGPGFGETRVHGLPVTLTNYPEAASLFLDWLCGRPEVNPDQIGIFGGSMGSYYGPTVAVNDSRIKAVVGLLGCYLEKDLQGLIPCQQGLRNNFKYMCNIYDDDDAFDEFVARWLWRRWWTGKVPFLMSQQASLTRMCPPES